MRMLSVQHLLGPVEEGEARASVRLTVDEASNLDARRGRAWPRVRGRGGRDHAGLSPSHWDRGSRKFQKRVIHTSGLSLRAEVTRASSG